MLSAQDVHDKQFRLVRQSTGYDIDEVDAFLDEVEAAIAGLTTALEAARAEAAAAAPVAPAGDEAPAQPPSPVGESDQPATAARILELAQQTADQYLAEARRTADSLVGDAEQAARAAVAELESQRTDLEARVTALRSFEAQIRGRLTGYFEGQLRDLRSLGSPGDAPPPA